jgi:hypothetical protein
MFDEKKSDEKKFEGNKRMHEFQRSLKRRTAFTLLPSEATNNFGESELLASFSSFDWRLVGRLGGDMDAMTVDATFRKNFAEIDVQLKTRNFDWDNGRWAFEIFKNDKQLDLDFYNRRHTYLFLCGIKFVKTNDGFHRAKVGDEIAMIALIPGKVIARYCKANPKARQITLYEQKMLDERYIEWGQYIGEKNIRKLLAKEEQMQRIEEQVLNEYWTKAEREEEEKKKKAREAAGNSIS